VKERGLIENAKCYRLDVLRCLCTREQVGLQLLDDFVFIHLDHPLDKFNLLLQMLHKLYALVPPSPPSPDLSLDLPLFHL
jgi:hypothetical protein